MSKRAIFLDRDGTLIEHYDYLTDPSQVKLIPRTSKALKRLKDRGYLLVVVTNQSAVARGMLTEKKLAHVHDHLQSILGREGVFLDRIYYCPYHPEAVVDKYRRDSELRKPKPGMLYWASQELGIDLSSSWMIGDDDRDIEAGKAAGCRTVMLENRGSSLVRKGDSSPDFTAVNLQEAANLIIRYADRKKPTISEKDVEDAAENNTSAAAAEEDSTPKQQPETKTVVEGTDDADDDKTDSGGNGEVMISDGAAPATDSDLNTNIPPDDRTTARRPPKKKQNKSSNAQADENRITDISAIPTEPTTTAIKDDTEEEKLGSDMSEYMLLRQILRELKILNRAEHIESDFSVMKLIAGITQMLVILCVVMMFIVGMGPDGDHNGAVRFLLLGVIFQVMTLTMLIGFKP